MASSSLSLSLCKQQQQQERQRLEQYKHRATEETKSSPVNSMTIQADMALSLLEKLTAISDMYTLGSEPMIKEKNHVIERDPPCDGNVDDDITLKEEANANTEGPKGRKKAKKKAKRGTKTSEDTNEITSHSKSMGSFGTCIEVDGEKEQEQVEVVTRAYNNESRRSKGGQQKVYKESQCKDAPEKGVSRRNTKPARMTSNLHDLESGTLKTDPSYGVDVELHTSSSLNTTTTDDASLILSMERTLFAALNNAWLLALGGIGLMAIGDSDQRAVKTGVGILGLSVFTAVFACGMHNWRVYQRTKGQSFQYWHTVFWGSIISLLVLLTLSLEIYNGILHPYLQRAASVTLVDTNSNMDQENVFGQNMTNTTNEVD